MSDKNSEKVSVVSASDETVNRNDGASGGEDIKSTDVVDRDRDAAELSETESSSVIALAGDNSTVTLKPDISSSDGRASPISDTCSVHCLTSAKSSIAGSVSRIGRPCCTGRVKPAVPSHIVPAKSNHHQGVEINRNHEERKKRSSATGSSTLETLWELHPKRLSEAGLRRASDASVVLTEDTDSFIIGQRVYVGGTKPGLIAYIGETQFAPGEWAGIVLDEPIGKNDGSVAGTRYFQCEPRRGVFSRLTRLTREPLSQAQTTINENDLRPCAVSTPKSKQTSPGNISGRNNLVSNSALNTSTNSLASVCTDLKLGDRVIVRSSATTGSKPGILRYIGTTEFAPGEWCGVELDDPVGKNDGSVDGVRYFDCQPFYGLFTPINKVSKSPSARRPSSHIPHRAGSTTSGVRRSNSRESLNSLTSSIASSVRTTGISSTSRVRLGVTSLNASKRVATSAKGIPPTPRPTTTTALQDALRDKEMQITKLLRERELDRAEVTRAATQADHAEQLLATLTQNYEKLRAECEQKLKEKDFALCQVQTEKERLLAQIDEEKRRAEDLQFKFEETAINKGDVEVSNKNYLTRIKELEQILNNERHKVEELEKNSDKLFEAEEELTKVKDELDIIKKKYEQNEQSGITSADQLTKTIEEYKRKIESQASQLEEYSSKIFELENLYEKSLNKVTEQEKQIEVLKAELNSQVENIKAEASTKQDSLDKQVQKLKSELNSKENTIEKYTEEIKKKNSELAQLQIQLETAHHELKLKDEHIENHVRSKREAQDQYSQDIQQLNNQLRKSQEEFQVQKMEAAKQIMTANDELVSSQNALKSYQEYARKLQSDMSTMQASASSSIATQLELQRGIIQERDNKLLELNAQFEQKCKELTECHDTNTKQVQELHQYAAQIETYKKDFEILYQKLQNEEGVNCNLTTKINTMELQIGELSRKLIASEEHATILLQQKNNLEIEMKQLLARGSDANGKLVDCSNRYQQVSQQLEQCRQEYVTQQQKYERQEQEFTQTINHLQQQRSKEQQEAARRLDDQQQQIVNLENKCQQEQTEMKRIQLTWQQQLDEQSQMCNNKMAEYEKIISENKITIENLQMELERHAQESQQTGQKCQQLEIQLNTAIQERKDMIKEKNDLIVELEGKCKQMFQESQSKYQQLQQQCNADLKQATEEIANLRVTLQTREQQIHELNIQLNNISQDKTSMGVEHQKYIQIIENLKVEMTNIQKQNEQCQQEITNKNHQLSISTSTINELNLKLSNCEQQANEYQHKLQAITRECIEIRETMITNQRLCTDRENQLKDLEKLKEEYNKEKVIIITESQQKDKTIHDLLLKIDSMKQQQCVACEGRIVAIRNSYEMLTEQYNQKEEDVTRLQEDLKRMDLECHRTQSEIQIWRNEYEKLKNESMTIENKCSEKDVRINELLDQINIITQRKDQEVNHRINVLEQQLNNYKIQFTTYQQQCEQKSIQIHELERQIMTSKQEVCKESETKFIVLKQQCDQTRDSFENLQRQCQEKQDELLIVKENLETTIRECQNAENKVIVLKGECSVIQNQYHNLQRECQQKIQHLNMCQQQLEDQAQVGNNERTTQPVMINDCTSHERQIFILNQQLDQLKNENCDVNIICKPFIQQRHMNTDLQKCQAQVEQCQQQIDVQSENATIQLQVCVQHQEQLTKRCREELIINNNKIINLELEQNKCAQLESIIQQHEITINMLKEQTNRRCEMLQLELTQKDDQLKELQQYIKELQLTIKTPAADQKYEILQLQIHEKETQIQRLNVFIKEIQQKINQQMQCQEQNSQLNILQLQLKEKDIQINSQTEIIHKLKVALNQEKECDVIESNDDMYKIQIAHLEQILQQKQQLIVRLREQLNIMQNQIQQLLQQQTETETQMTQTTEPMHTTQQTEHNRNRTSESGDDVITPLEDENNRLRRELHWQILRAIELQNRFTLIVKENTELLTKLHTCQTTSMFETALNTTHINSENWHLEKLTLLEQIEELKCELEERAKELIICKTRLPCLQHKTFEKDLSLALEQAHQEKFTALQHGVEIQHSATAHALGENQTGGSMEMSRSSTQASSSLEWQKFQQAENQIQFLNSIIIEMQQKNEALRSKIEILEANCVQQYPVQTFDDLTKSKTKTPRMFCDICDEFDLHETEDCPNQDSELLPSEAALKPRHTPKAISSDRPYCDICEVFGHTTEDCDETETF